MDAIIIKNLTKKYNDIIALNNLSLNVPKGSIFGFIGPNGAGKTTTLKILTGFIHADSGTIETSSKNISFLPDVPGFYGYMTPNEFLMLCANINDISDKEKRISELLDFTGLKHKNRKISSFSRGMLQRLGIAQALITKPDILYLDEPVSALDPIGRKQVLEILKALKGNITVFFSTHILADVERICDYAAIINEGNLIKTGSIEELLKTGKKATIELKLSKINDLIINEIKSQSYVDSLNIKDDTLFISVLDKDKAGIKLIDLVKRNNLILYKYNIRNTDLEDIFIKAVNKK